MRHVKSAMTIGIPTPEPSVDPGFLRMHVASKSDGAINQAIFYERPMWLSPEVALHLAILEKALEDDDRNWIIREDSVVSFRDCCDALGLEVSAARKALLARPAKPAKESKRRKYDLIVGDTPGFTYTHPYAECGKKSDCAECCQRYQHVYRNMVMKHGRHWTKKVEPSEE